MVRKLYGKPGEFLEENRDFLLESEALAQLNLGNAQAHREEGCHPGLLFGRIEEGGEMCLLFGNTAPWNICLNAPQGMEKSMEAAGELARYLREEDIEIAGVTAREDLAKAFMEAYGGEFSLRSSMDIMVLREIRVPPAVPGRMRKATLSDTDFVLNGLCGFMKDIFNEDTRPEDHKERWLPRIENGQLYLWEAPGGEIVSMAATVRPLEHGDAINAVYTPPQHRGKGYCQNTVAAVCQEKLKEGKEYCTLFVDKKNPISNRVYQKIGFEIKENCYEYKLLK